MLNRKLIYWGVAGLAVVVLGGLAFAFFGQLGGATSSVDYAYGVEPDFAIVEAEESMAEAAAPMAAFEPRALPASDIGFGGGDDGAFFADEAVANQSAEFQRLVIKNADLSVVVDDPSVSMDRIAQRAEAFGGFVVSSNQYQTMLASGVEVPQGFIMVRVPAARFTEFMAVVEGDANRVISKNISGQDVTQQYTDLQSRLRNLAQAEDELREIMASAVKTEDVLNVYNHLTNITNQIEVIKGQIQFYEQSAAMSAISVNLIADAAVQPVTIGGWEPVGIAKDAIQALVNTLQGIANLLIWITLYLLPTLVVMIIPLWVLWRIVRGMRTRSKAKKAQAKE